MTEKTQRGVVVPSPGQSVANGIALLALLRQLGLSVDAAIGSLGAVANLSPEALAALEAFDGEVELSDAVVAGLLESATEARDALDARVTDPGVATPATAAALNWEVAQTSLGTVDHATVQAAATAAASSGKRLYAAGEYTTDQTLVLACNADLSGLTINYTGTGTAVKIGTPTTGDLGRLNIAIGHVIDAGKPAGANWNDTVGVQISNTYRCRVKFTRIAQFGTGLLLLGDSSYGSGGVAYNTFELGHLENNKVNQSLQLLTGGGIATPFVNQNVYLGGSMSHSDGTYPVSGMAQIVIGTTGGGSLNNNLWLNTSLEGQREEYILDVHGNDNMWLNCRYEFVSNPPPVRWNAAAARNMIIGGYQVDDIVQVVVSGAISNNILGTLGMEFTTGTSGGLVLSRGAGGSTHALTVMPNNWRRDGRIPSTGYTTKVADGLVVLKATGDSHHRLSLDGINQRIGLGSSLAAEVAVLWGTGTPEGSKTAPPGSLYFRYDASTTLPRRFVKQSGTGNTGWAADGFQPTTTAERPSAAAVGAGGSMYDTTLAKPIWSDGTTWRDAAGTAV